MSPRTPYSHFAHVRCAEGAVAQAKVILQYGPIGGRIDLTVAVSKDWQLSIARHIAPLRTVIIGDVVGVSAQRIRRLGDICAADSPLTYEDRCQRTLQLDARMIGTRFGVIILVIYFVGRRGMGLITASEAT